MVRIYTDGACSGSPGEGGWAIVVCTEKKIKVFSGGEKETTNNRMELQAFYNALRCAKQNKFSLIEILSDSSYVINAITKGWLEKWKSNGWINSQLEPVKNKDLWQKVDQIKQIMVLNGYNVKYTKVKGHSGNKCNDMADEAAKREVKKLKGVKNV